MLLNKKALVLFSGGLDSMLAVKILQEQGFEVYGVAFESNFFNADKAKESAEQINLKKLFVVDISDEVLGLVKNPPHGHGKNLNPCIDCHGLMIKKAGEIAKKEGIVLVATGEVLGQRPFSQNKDALRIVKKISGVDVLRPLSAKLLEETDLEKNKIINRDKLGDIQGRRRDGQDKLIRKYGLKSAPSPAGGCLLTDPQFSKRLKLMLENWPDAYSADIALLRFGRVFWFDCCAQKILLIIGRNQSDNEFLEKFAKKNDFMLELKKHNGPLSLLRAPENFKENFKKYILSVDSPTELPILNFKFNKFNDIIKISATLTAFYAKKTRGSEVELEVF